VVEGETAVSREVVGVRVRLEHADQADAVPLRLGKVLLHCVRGIDDRRDAFVLVADQVRGTSEPVVDELPEDHESSR
jgi:hypothetical protein